MAGYTLGFDDGGDVPDQPVIPTDDGAAAAPAGDTQTAPAAGAAPAAPSQDQGQAEPGFVPGGAPGLGQAVNGGVKKIISYLMGADAADPKTAKTFEQGVKHENPGVSDDDANLLAVHQAGEMGGPGAAWAMVQYNRQAYNAKQSFAKAALNGIDGKAGNAQAAAQAASQAGAHILDGSSTVFTAMPGGEGFTAAVKMPGTDRSVTFQLNPQQMNTWLDVGGHGQWDKVMEEGGVATTLQKITASSGGAATAAPKGKAPDDNSPDSQYMGAVKDAREDNQDSDPETPEANPNAGKPTNIGKTPSSLNLSGSDTQDATLPPKPYSYGKDLEAQSRAAFPNISDEGKRQQFMTQQQGQRSTRINELGKSAMGAAAKENVAKTTAGARTQSSQITADSRTDVADTNKEGRVQSAQIRSDKDVEVSKQKANATLQVAMTKARSEQERNNIARARLMINDPNQALRGGKVRDPEDILKEFGLSPGSPAAAPAPGAASPQAAPKPAAPSQQATQRPANVPQGAKFYQGKWYTRGPDGSAVPVQ